MTTNTKANKGGQAAARDIINVAGDAVLAAGPAVQITLGTNNGGTQFITYGEVHLHVSVLAPSQDGGA